MNTMYRETSIPGVDVLNLKAPLYGQFELTFNCNYHCQMCYNIWKGANSNASTHSLTRKQQFTTIDKLAPYLFSMIFSGGEPTLVKWLPELVAHTSGYGINCALITNAALMESSLARRLFDAGLESIQVSLHHFKPGMSDAITGVKNSLKKTLSGALGLLDVFGASRISINMVVNSETANDVYDMGQFIHSHGFKNFGVGVLSCSGEAKANGLKVSIEDLCSVFAQLSRLHQELDLWVGLSGGVPFCLFPKDADKSVKICNICDAAIHQIVIGADGNCRPCVEAPWIGGNILTDTIETIWMSSAFEDMRMFRNVPSRCCNCKYVSNCHGGCRTSAFNYTGSKTGHDPLMPSEMPYDFIFTFPQPETA